MVVRLGHGDRNVGVGRNTSARATVIIVVTDAAVSCGCCCLLSDRGRFCGRQRHEVFGTGAGAERKLQRWVVVVAADLCASERLPQVSHLFELSLSAEYVVGGTSGLEKRPISP